MAKLVIAGKANCPHYAKAELLGDYLQRNLPNFIVHKWPIESKDWDAWVKSTCDKNQWKPPKQSSPLVWRELIDRGGRGTLVGDLDDFQEYAHCYYGTILNHFMANTSKLFRAIADENAQQYAADLESNHRHIAETVHPYHICIIGADHPCAYSLFPDLMSAKLFPHRDICLRLTTHDPTKLSALQAVAMEIEDLACKQFRAIEVSLQDNAHSSYKDTDFILILDDYFGEEKAKHLAALAAEKARLSKVYDEENLFADERPPFKPEKMKYDLHQAYSYYKALANGIQATLKPTCRILLACSDSIMIATQAFVRTVRTIPSKQILGLARTVENQAKARIGKKLAVDIQNVVDLHIVGDINGDYIIDTNSCQAVDYEGAIWAQTFLRNSTEMLADSKFIKEVIGKEVDEREFELYTRVERNRTLVHTQARAILSFIKDWVNGSNDAHSYSCVMSCSSSSLGLTATHDDEQADKTIICSIPVLMKGQDEILPIDLNLTGDNRTALTRILKDMQIKYKLD